MGAFLFSDPSSARGLETARRVDAEEQVYIPAPPDFRIFEEL